MAILHVTDEVSNLIQTQIDTGNFENADEVIHAALHEFVELRRQEQEALSDERKLEELRKAIQDGFDSGVAEDGVIERLRQRFNLA